MTYATQSVGKIIHHLKQHKSSCYLPKSLTSENEEFHPITVDAHDLEILKRETPRKAELAIKNFGKILMEMDYFKLSFSPVMVEIQGQVYESPRSDFFRSLALFESSFYFGEINWRLLENFQNVAKIYRERISAFGKSVGVQVHPFYKRESPHPTDYETQTYISGPYDQLPLEEHFRGWE